MIMLVIARQIRMDINGYRMDINGKKECLIVRSYTAEYELVKHTKFAYFTTARCDCFSLLCKCPIGMLR